MNIIFTPRALTEVLKEIQAKHPIVKGDHGEGAEALVDQVRRLLQQTHHEEIQPLAMEFKPVQVKACLYLLEDKEVGAKALEVLLLRARNDVYVQAWKLLVRTYPASDALQQLVKVLFNAMGTAELINAGVAPTYVDDWMKGNTLSAGVYAHYSSKSGKQTCDEYLFASGLLETDGLFSGTWQQLLAKGTAKDLLAQGGKRILMEFLKPTTGGEARVAYGRRYLNALKTQDNWYVPILEFIAKRFGRPAGRHEHEDPFWEKVDEQVRSEYLKWHLTKQILDFFEGERAEFWRYFVNTKCVLDVRKTLSGMGFMLDFGTFGVIEFKEIGNAAYIYPKALFDNYWQKANSYDLPSQLKQKTKTIHKVGSEGRIIHGQGWQQKAGSEIKRLLR